MNVSFLAAELGKWDHLDEAAPDALVLTFFSDERPLRGAAGLCDWRLCGRLSRMLKAGKLKGDLGEVTLYPPPRLPFSRLVLFGLGPSGGFDEARAREAAGRILETMRGMRVGRWALIPPGRSTGRLSARRALEIFLEEADRGTGDAPYEIVVVESAAGQKEAAELARR